MQSGQPWWDARFCLCALYGLTPVVVTAGIVVGAVVHRSVIGIRVGALVVAATIEIRSARIEALRQAGCFLRVDGIYCDRRGDMERNQRFCGNPGTRSRLGCRRGCSYCSACCRADGSTDQRTAHDVAGCASSLTRSLHLEEV